MAPRGSGQQRDGSPVTAGYAPVSVVVSHVGSRSQSAGESFSCTIFEADILKCWGNDYRKRLGNGLDGWPPQSTRGRVLGAKTY